MRLLLAFVFAALAACAGPGGGTKAMTPAPAARPLVPAVEGRATEETDPCEERRRYGDGVCDEFCPEVDPDCDPKVCSL